MTQVTDFDVVIIGGGPAGSALAGYLGKAGVNCAVFEKEIFPRPHVGESLVPSSTRVFRDLDMLEQMEAHKFPRKFGAVWTAPVGASIYDHDWEGLAPDCEADVRFEERDQEGVDKNYTYHVDRGEFDLLMLKNAERLGATVYQGVAVSRVDLGDQQQPATVTFRLGQQEVNVRAKMVVDCSGRNTLMGRQLGLRIQDDVFDQFALHSWFEDYDRGPDRADYIWIHFLPITNTWIWQIPITETITSIGIVTQKKNFEGSKSKRDDFFRDCLMKRPEIYEKVKAARQLRPLKVEADYSYANTQICGDRFALVGDAARFVDPIFSSGVSIALTGARFIAPEIIKAVEADDFSKSSFANFERNIRNGTRNWYEFISLYYRLNVLFTYFVNDKRYRLDVLKLLQGDVYDEEEPEVLQEMRKIVTEVEGNPDHMWHKLLGDLTGNEFRPRY